MNGSSSSTDDARTRLILFHGTSVSAEAGMTMEDDEIGYDFLLSSGVKSTNLLAAGYHPMKLKERGFDTAIKLRSFGFDALHLCEPSWCHQLLLAYGRDEVVAAFVVTAADAVAVAGSEAMTMLNLTPSELLERCAGFPSEAYHTLRQLPHGLSLRGVPALVLLDAGLRVSALKACGYGLIGIVDQTGANPREVAKLGFTM